MKLIPAGDLESANPVMPVRWCLEPKDVVVLAERDVDINAAYIAFVIVDDRDRETRQLVPMSQMMEYLDFYHPGVHRVFAKVIYGEERRIKREVLEKRSHYSYTNQLLDYEKCGFLDDSCTAKIEVVIPKEHFPKEPPAWLRKIVEWGYDYPSVDQCQFRRRCIFSIPKVILAGTWAVITTLIRIILAIAGTVLTLRDVKYEAVIHPWRFGLLDVFREMDLGDSWLFHKNPKTVGGRVGIWRSWWLVLLYPPLWLAAYIIVESVASFYHVGFLAAILLILKAIVHAIWWSRWIIGGAGVLFLALLLLASARAKKLESRYDEKEEQRKRELRRWARERAQKEREALVGLLTCGTEPMVVQLQAIPSERRTFHLRYRNFKAKVCRPFAR